MTGNTLIKISRYSELTSMYFHLLFISSLLFLSVPGLAKHSVLGEVQYHAEDPPPPPKNRAKEIPKLHILYLLQSQEYYRAIDLYFEYKSALGRHDFEILQQMALILLEQGARSQDADTQLASIYASSMTQIAASIDILEAGIFSPHPETQIAAVHYLGHLQEDRCEELLTKAMSSDFFMTRLEAAQQLALRKTRNATGQVESLMYKLPPQLRYFFPPLFALIGTKDAVALLRHMMDEKYDTTRIAAILSAARHGRDDLLPMIRKKATHLNIAEQEACAFALGVFKDSKALSLLRRLSQSPADTVCLAAKRALIALGEDCYKKDLLQMAQEGNLFAINLLEDLEEGKDILISLVNHADIQVRFNATVALLHHKDPSVAKTLMEFLLRDARDLGFQPIYSPGHALMAWKIIPSATQQQALDEKKDLIALSLSIRETLLRESIELPEATFLHIAKQVFDSKQTDLIPLLVHLIENVQTPSSLDLLQGSSQTAGAPLVRAYCNLALLRLQTKEVYRQTVLQWLELKKETPMTSFRPMVSLNHRSVIPSDAFELTPKEHTRLLIESYQTIALEHAESSIDVLLKHLQTGHVKNRPVLAGLLIQAIQ